MEYGWEINPHIWHGEAQFTLFGPNMEAWSYSLALRDLDTMQLSESPQYWAMCCLHKYTVILASNNLCLLLASLGCLMQQLTTVYQNPKRLIRQPSLSKMSEIALPTPLRIDAPASIFDRSWDITPSLHIRTQPLFQVELEKDGWQ